MDSEALIARALWTFAAAFGLWLVKEIVEGLRGYRLKLRQQDNLVRALYAEIDFNTCDMELFLEISPSEEKLRGAMSANPQLVPHITDARHTEIYRNRIGELHSVRDTTLAEMVHFYGMLEKIKVQIDGVNYPSYTSLSVEGKMNGVMVIVLTAKLARRFGLGLLQQMERDYAHLGLKRFERGVADALGLPKRDASRKGETQNARR